MKRGVVIGIIIFVVLLVIILIIYPKSNIKEWGKSCNTQIERSTYPERTFSYPGARAFLYGGDPQCHHVYEEAFKNNNQEICNYLENQNAKAICVGSSSSNINNLEICGEFNGEPKEVCLINILLKDYNLNNLTSKSLSENICKQINTQPLKSICLSYVVEIFEDTSLCNFEGELQLICLKRYASKDISLPLSEEELLEGVEFCDSFFENSIDRILCYETTIVNFLTFLDYSDSYGDEETGKRYFYDYNEILNRNLIILRLSKLMQETGGSFYERGYYSCESIFSELDKIPLECEIIEGHYCLMDYSTTCQMNIPHWAYYSSY